MDLDRRDRQDNLDRVEEDARRDRLRAQQTTMSELNDERIDFKGGFFHIAPPHDGSVGGEWDVWFNAELDFDGVCVGSGTTRDDAVADARATMEGALAALRN